MTTLANIVEIDRRFARSTRIDTDISGATALAGYVLQSSTAKALSAMASAQIETGQAAFTWTGPYGGGKSSAALLLASLVSGDEDARAQATAIAGPEIAGAISEAFPTLDGNWQIVPVTGTRASLRESIVQAAEPCLAWSTVTSKKAARSDTDLIDALLRSSSQNGRVLLILDELGKLLEQAAAEHGDIHLLQDLAERATRSGRKLVVIGILHQAFDQYVARLGRTARDEWAKVQGRYQDISFLAGADETVGLLARAIRVSERPDSAEIRAREVAEAVAKRRPTDIEALTASLQSTWPLNPVTAMLLGPLSRQRFAQNERSVFGFLSSAEPSGFQAYLAATDAMAPATYGPDQLWDYLAANFGMALASGPDGARFSLAFEAIERAAVKGSSLHVSLTKAAAMIEAFRNGSGLALTRDFLRASAPLATDADLETALGDLVDWAILIEQPRMGGYALFSGSDFDLEAEVRKTIQTDALDPERVSALPERVGLGVVAAKRHYFETGALRTFEVVVMLVGEADAPSSLIGRLVNRHASAAGQLILLLSDGELDQRQARNLAKNLAVALRQRAAVAAVSAAPNSYALRPFAAELFALERIIKENPRLEGDRIARREIAARQSQCVTGVHKELESALNAANWFIAPSADEPVVGPLAQIASHLADAAFDAAPVLKSELLQRDRPSSNAMAALRELCHAMVKREAEKDLGFEGYPAAMGLYLTVIQPFGLHTVGPDGRYKFGPPSTTDNGPSLLPAWSLAERESQTTLDILYQTWSKPPFGIKAGVMPILGLATILARRDRLAVYVDDVFQTEIDDVFVDRLLQSPEEIRLRGIDRSFDDRTFLDQLADVFGLGRSCDSLPVARALFRRFEALPPYAKRTDTLPGESKRVRDVVLKSSDPEALLFESLPTALGDRLSAQTIATAISDGEAAYPALLAKVEQALAKALGVEDASFAGLAERVNSIRGLTRDWAFEAFAIRAGAFEEGVRDVEGLASLLLHKSPRTWTDRDADHAFTEIAKLGQRFRELETMAVIRDRHSTSEAMALVVGVDPKAPPILESFQLSATERKLASKISKDVLRALRVHDVEERVQLAALARAILELSDQKVSA